MAKPSRVYFVTDTSKEVSIQFFVHQITSKPFNPDPRSHRRTGKAPWQNVGNKTQLIKFLCDQ